jgi:Spy/CpxP family protein refolding chaperone
MKKLALTGVLVAGLVLAGSAARGQGMGVPMGRWWERPQVMEQLGLSQDQKQKLEAITLDGARSMVDLKAAVEKAQIDLRAASDLDPFQPDKVREAFHAMQQARVKLESQRFEMLLKVRGVLTVQQWRQLRELVHERGGMRGRPEGEEHGPRREPN